MSSPIGVPVVVIGGGGCGLDLSIFLSDLNVEHILFEKHPGTLLLPKAHHLNQCTMEIFRQHGMDEELEAVATPIHNMCKIEWKMSLSGNEIYDGRVLGSVASFGGQPGTPVPLSMGPTGTVPLCLNNVKRIGIVDTCIRQA
jgi:2,4-dichlorophenol 6-monooxygenase